MADSKAAAQTQEIKTTGLSLVIAILKAAFLKRTFSKPIRGEVTVILGLRKYQMIQEMNP